MSQNYFDEFTITYLHITRKEKGFLNNFEAFTSLSLNEVRILLKSGLTTSNGAEVTPIRTRASLLTMFIERRDISISIGRFRISSSICEILRESPYMLERTQIR